MYIRNGQPFNIHQTQMVDGNQYPPSWFEDSAQRALFNIFSVSEPVEPAHTDSQKVALTGFTLNANTHAWDPQWIITAKSQAELDADAATLVALKITKNIEINAWRDAANSTTFPYNGKYIACDELSFKDIASTAGHISLFGTFPTGFPGAWKYTDNSYLLLPDVAAFKAMYTAMTTQGTANFTHSQTLKSQLAAATSISQVNAIVW